MEKYFYNTLDGIKKYRDHPALNQSSLKAFMDKRKFGGESVTMLLGSYLDAKVTLSPEETDNTFIFFDGKRPSEAVTDLCDKLKLSLENVALIAGYKKLEEYGDYLEEFLADKDFYANLNLKQRADNFVKKAGDWWDFLIASEDKFILTVGEKAIQDSLALKVKDFLKKITHGKDVNVHFQKDFYWDWDGVACKGLGDMIFELEDKIVEIDLKFTTAKSLEGWAYVAKDLNLMFQKAFYKKGLEENYKKPIVSYWLVVSQNFIHLIHTPTVLINQGLYGFTEVKSKLCTNLIEEQGSDSSQELNVFRHNYGVLEAMKYYKDGLPEHPEIFSGDKTIELFYGKQPEKHPEKQREEQNG